ncbi:recombinase family protein [Demequina rhizosphaerae]|uniref:recombinase family protein n=1 Tax=Demequina rhizosphaerae TaxID=1638985 RepID=UPI0007812075|nr:recombinase family protein [Demequina rhizosphaerae]
MNATATPKRAVVYVRLSRHQGAADPSTSPESQRKRCEAFAEAKGWEVVEVVEDLDVSGSDKGDRLNRPGLKKIRKRWADIDVVIFAKIDRLARNVVDFNTFAEEAKGHGVALVSVAESLDLSTPGGRFTANILAAFAEMEAATIQARVKQGRVDLIEARRWAGTRPPYGYRSAPHPSGKGRGLVQVPNEVEILRGMVAEFLPHGAATDPAKRHGSANAIARRLTADGIPAPRSAYRRAQLAALDGRPVEDLAVLDRGKWNASTVRALMRGNALAGYMTRDPERIGKDRPDPASLDVVRDAHGAPEVVWSPVVDGSTLRALRKRFPASTRKAPAGPVKGRKPSGLLSGKDGLAKCGLCGGTMNGGTSGGSPSYRCDRPGGGALCSGVSIRRAALDAIVEEAFLGAYGRLLVTIVEEVADDTALAAEREEVDGLLSDLEARKRAASPADRRRLLSEEAALWERHDALGVAAPETRTVVRETGETFAEAWESADLVDRRAFLAARIDLVEVAPASKSTPRVDSSRVTIYWRLTGEDAREILSPAEAVAARSAFTPCRAPGRHDAAGGVCCVVGGRR